MVQFTVFLKESGLRIKIEGTLIVPPSISDQEFSWGRLLIYFCGSVFGPVVIFIFFFFLRLVLGEERLYHSKNFSYLFPSAFSWKIFQNWCSMKYSLTHTVQVEEDHDWAPVSQGSCTGCLTWGTYLTSLSLTFLICSKSKSVLIVLESCAFCVNTSSHLSLSDT